VSKKDPADEGMGQETDGIEIEFAMIDGKEQDAIKAWTNKYRHLFGRDIATDEKGSGTTVEEAANADDDTDPEDESFELDPDDENDDGSVSSSSDSEKEGNSGSDAEMDGEISEVEEDKDGGPDPTTNAEKKTTNTINLVDDEEDELDE